MMDGGDIARAGAWFDEQCRRVAGDPDEKKNRQRQQEQRQQRIAGASHHKTLHYLPDPGPTGSRTIAGPRSARREPVARPAPLPAREPVLGPRFALTGGGRPPRRGEVDCLSSAATSPPP